MQFADLGLVVVDEQHKFGVEQRDALRAKARDDRRPHVLVMTATPIPRTVAMTVYGDLEVSTLTELPKGRAPITTAVAPIAGRLDWRDAVWERVRDEVKDGHQAFIVCPRIGGDEPDDPDDSGDDRSSRMTPRPTASTSALPRDRAVTADLQRRRCARPSASSNLRQN